MKKSLLQFIIPFIFLAASCKKETQPDLPVLMTLEITSVTEDGAVSGGDITDDGDVVIIGRGVCWSTETEPTIDDFKTDDGSGSGEFSSTIAGLTQLTTYYLRAYATNSVGTAYGNQLTFATTGVLPTISTTSVSDLKSTSVKSGGEVVNDGGTPIVARGVCWSTSSLPTINDNKIEEGNGTGVFECSVTSLNRSTTYFLRSWATNSAGTAYGDEVSFTTPLYSIGESYGGGIIFYIDETGEHGLVVADSDQSSGANWGCTGTDISTSADLGSGMQNTLNILAGCSTAGIAVRICDELDLNGFQDWYLPSIDELSLVDQNLYETGLLSFPQETYYWSSTQYNANLASYLSFEWDYTGGMIKSTWDGSAYRQVRAIRSF